MKSNFFKQTPLADLYSDVQFQLWDIGARGSFDQTFAPFAWSINAIGFEPDPEAYKELNPTGHWRSEKFMNLAIGESNGMKTLNVTKDPEGSSFLEHDTLVGERFNLSDLFTLEKHCQVNTLTLQDAMMQNQLPIPNLLKLDVEGMELPILKKGKKLLSSLVAIKIEGSFIQQRHGQALVPEIIVWLNKQGFCFMDIIEPARWRTKPWATDPYIVNANPGYSRGRLVQGDLIFLKEPKSMETSNLAEAVLSSIGLGYFDHGLEIFNEHEDKLSKIFELDPKTFREHVDMTSGQYGKTRIRNELARNFKHLTRLIRSYWGGLNTPNH